jgi:hypothetical protein
MIGIFQSMDVGINGPFKARIRSLWNSYWIDNTNETTDANWQHLINIINQIKIYY